MLDEIVCHKLDILAKAADYQAGKKSLLRSPTPNMSVNVAFVGKYVDLTESYKSLTEALIHAGIHTESKVKIHFIDSEILNEMAPMYSKQWMHFGTGAVSASAVQKAKLQPLVLLEKIKFHISVFALACSWQ